MNKSSGRDSERRVELEESGECVKDKIWSFREMARKGNT